VAIKSSEELRHAVLLVFARVLGAGVAFLNALLCVHNFGKELAGDFFFLFSLTYFLAQVVRLGGEIDSLTSRYTTDFFKSALPKSISISICVGCLVALLFVLGLAKSPWLVCLGLYAFFLSELVGDYYKKFGSQTLGVLVASMVNYWFLIVLMLKGPSSTVVDCYAVASVVSVTMSMVLIAWHERDFFLLAGDWLPSLSTSAAALSNLLNFSLPPITLYFSAALFGAAFSSDFRVASRLSAFLFIIYGAAQQIILRRLGDQSAYERVRDRFLLITLPLTTFGILLIVASLMILNSCWRGFSYEFLESAVVWSSGFFIAVNTGFATVFMVMRREFSRLAVSRIVAYLFTLSGICGLAMFDGWQSTALFSLVCVSYYIAQNVIALSMVKWKT
jgi:hypothetical protein